MSKLKKELNYPDYLFDKTNVLNSKFLQISNEVFRLQSLVSTQQRAFEKYNKTIKVKDPRKGFVHLESFCQKLYDYYNESFVINKNHITNVSQKVEALEHLRKYVENNRKFLYRRASKNEKQYLKNKGMLSVLQEKQRKTAFEAHEWYIKHKRLLEPNIQESQIQSVELKLIQAVNEEKRISKMYRNVCIQTKDYQQHFIDENKEVLKRYQEFDVLLLNSVKSHMCKFIDDQQSLIEKMKINLENFRKEVESFDLDDVTQQFIVKNHNPYFKLEKKHKYDPYIPIYQKPVDEHNKILDRTRDLKIDKTSKFSQFLDRVYFKRGKIIQKPRKGHRRMKTELIIKTVDRVNFQDLQKTNKRIEEKPKTEEVFFFEEFIDKLIKEGEDKKLDDDLKKANKYLEKIEGRTGFARALNFKRHSPYVVEKDDFKIMSDLVAKCLTMSYDKQDADVGKMLLNMSQTFYTQEGEDFMYLITSLKDLKLWKDVRYWEGVFYDTMSDMRKRSVYFLNDQKWRELDERSKGNVEKEHGNMTFGVLTSIVFSMVEVKVSYNEVRKFIEKMCEINTLSKDQTKIIKTSFEEMMKKK